MSSTGFTIVLAIAYTDMEKKFLERSVKSAIKIKPDEIIFGVDKNVDPNLFARLERICESENFKNWKIIKVDKDPSWNFQLAHVIWECYSASKHDKILSYDVDSALRPEVMLGYDVIGSGNISVVSFTKKLVTRSIPELIRFVLYRINVKRSTHIFSGIYWIYRPFFFIDIDLQGYKKIHNGIDAYLIKKTQLNNIHKIITRKEMGVNCFNIQNEDYPWRQFQNGIWFGANREKFTMKYIQNYLKTHKQIPTYRKIYYKHCITIQILNDSILSYHPHLLAGYRWALKNTSHECVDRASNMSILDWQLLGSKYVSGLKKWKELGTGYSHAPT